MTDLFEAEAATTTTSLDLRRLQRMQRRATRRKWTLVMVSIGLVVFALAGSFAYNWLGEALAQDETTVADYEGLGQGTVQVIIESGDSGSDIATTLFDAGVVASREAFIAAAAENPDSASIKPGYYFMAREMKAEYALLALLDPNNRDLRKITLIEGRTLETYFAQIAELTGVDVAEVEAAAEDTEALGLPPEAEGKLEGWLFPSTYSFNPGVTPTDAMRTMVEQTITVLDRNGVPTADRLRILTIASLIEKEAKLAVDRPLISGVIYNRLEMDMRLELDSTVKYIAPSSGAFTTADDRAIDSPYNTYMYVGLPPGPIAGPGEESIAAAVAPAEHSYVFFVTVNLATGETAYAETFAQHQANVQILQQWVRDNGE